MESKKLSQLKIGETGIVENFSDQIISLKLMEMGCLPGEKIKLHNHAPMGDPLLIEVSGYFLSMRIKDAETVLVSQIY